MPSFARNSRSYSFPPCIDSVDFAPRSEADLPDIDDDPFAHFLTPVNEEDDPYDGLAMSAGIIVPDGPRTTKSSKFKSTVADKWARYVKQSQPQLLHRYHEAEAEDDESFVTLDDDRLLDTPQNVSLLSSPPRITITESTRGRAQDLISRKARNRRRYSRTLSGHRHSWREPSPDLFTVDESEEEDIPQLRRKQTLKSKKTKDGASRRSKGEVAEKSKL